MALSSKWFSLVYLIKVIEYTKIHVKLQIYNNNAIILTERKRENETVSERKRGLVTQTERQTEKERDTQ